MAVSVVSVATNLDRVRNQIADAGGDPAGIRVVAVTKGLGPDAPSAALAAGLADLGENYAQELLAKAPAVADADPPPTWHFIGRLQSNKVRQIASLVGCWQTVDRPSLVTEIARRAPGASILLQVNTAREPGKGGCDPSEAPELHATATDAGLSVRGVMAVGVAGDRDATSTAFERAASLADDLHLAERSMGMSGDIDLAVRAGATIVRVGTAIFGPRPEER